MWHAGGVSPGRVCASDGLRQVLLVQQMWLTQERADARQGHARPNPLGRFKCCRDQRAARSRRQVVMRARQRHRKVP
jgi:hypothetical protein